MKSKSAFRVFSVVSASALLFASQAQSAIYYWDTDGTIAGLGNTAGTWGTNTFWATVPAGILGGTLATTGPVTSLADVIYFGTNNLALGATASTVGIAGGGVTINTIVFGAGQTTPVTLSGGGGIITLAGTTPTITVNNTSDTIGAVLAGLAGITKAGAGTLILSGANTITGGVNINSGTVQVGDGISGSIVAQDVNFNGTGVFNVVGTSGGSSSQSIGNLKLTSGDATFQSTYGGSGTTTLNFTDFTDTNNSPGVITPGTTVNFVSSGGVNGVDNLITTSGSLSYYTNAYLYKSIFFNGSSYAAYDSAGFVRAVGAGDTDFVSVGAGTDMGACLSSNTVLLTGSLSAQGDTSVSTINLGANSIRMNSSTAVLQADGLLSSGSSNAIIDGGILQTTTSGGEMVIRVNGSSDQLTISSSLLDTGFTPLTKSGDGTLVLAGVNTYTGNTIINSGTLAVSSGNALVENAWVSLANAAGATLRLDNNETIGTLTGGGFSGGNVNVQGNTLTIDNSTANALAFGGAFSGNSSGAVTLNNGSLTLANKNTFAGTIRLMRNTQLNLTYGNDGTGSSVTVSSGGSISMADGSTLFLNPTAQAVAGVAGTSINSSLGGLGITNSIVVTSGIATVKNGAGGDAKYFYSGSVTGGTSGAQSINILQGASGGNGERTDILFSGVMQNGSGGILGVNVDFQSASGSAQGAAVNLSGQNTFTGSIAVSNTKNLTYTTSASYHGAWFAIGGENSYNGSTRVATMGTGYLGGGNYTNTITLAGGTVLNYLSSSNQILGGSISGRGNMVKEGTGSLTLSAENTFSGSTTIGAGKIYMTNALALQNSAYVTTGSNGSSIGLDVTSGLTSGSLTLGGLGGAVNLASAITAGYTGSVTNLTLNPQAGASNTYGGIIANGSGAMSLTKTGWGTQILSNTNTYTGGTIVNAGTLQLSGLFNMPGTGVLAINAGGNFSIADGTARTTTANGGLTLANGSSLTFDWKSGAADSLTTSADVTPTSGSIVGIGIVVSTPSGGPFTLISGGASSTLNNASYYLNNASNYTATLSKSATSVTIGSYASASALTSIYWTGNKLAGTATSGVDNALAFSNGALGNWSSSALTYTATGLTPGSTANVFFSNVQASKAQQSTVLGAHLTVSSVTIDDSTAVAIGGSHILTLMSGSGTAGSVNQTSGAGTAGSAITVTANAANPTISTNIMLGANQTWNIANGKTLTVSGNIFGTANTTSLTKADAGTLLLSGTNSFSGGLNINAGTVQLGSIGALNNASNLENAVTFGSGSTGILALAGNSITISNLNTHATPGTTFVQNANGSSVANASLTVGNAYNLSGSYAGTIRNGTGGGTLSVIKSALGRLVLSNNANSYTGVTTINGGILTVNSLANGGSNSGIGASSNDAGNLILNGGTLQYAGLSGVSTDRLFSLQSGSTIEASGTGAVNFTNIGSIGFNGGTDSKTLTLDGSNTGNNTIASVIGDNTGATALTKSGEGTWVLSGTNTYTGTTTVNSGILRAGADAGGKAFGNHSAVRLSGKSGTTLDLNNFNQTIGSLAGGAKSAGNVTLGTGTLTVGTDNTSTLYAGEISGTGGLTKTGGGELTITGNHTYSGPTTVSSGSLVIQGAVASTSLVVNGSLRGSGRMLNGTIRGSGSIHPGSNYGVMTANALNPSDEGDYNFEFGAANTLPTWSSPTLSLNDVLRLTDASAPITVAMDSTNLVSIFLNVASISSGDIFTGGFFTDKNASFLSWISGADFKFYLADSNGSTTYNGNKYDLYSGPLSFTVDTTSQTADFGDGNVSGYTTKFTTVSDPYLEWAGSGVNFNDDENGDGVPNGLAWLLGAVDPDANARPYLPVITVSSGEIRLLFSSLNTTSRGSASIKVQYSNDLGIVDSWVGHQAEIPDASGTDSNIVFTITANGDYNTVDARIPASAAGTGKKLFARVIATQP